VLEWQRPATDRAPALGSLTLHHVREEEAAGPGRNRGGEGAPRGGQAGGGSLAATEEEHGGRGSILVGWGASGEGVRGEV
jgi:hypothetical protein